MSNKGEGKVEMDWFEVLRIWSLPWYDPFTIFEFDRCCISFLALSVFPYSSSSPSLIRWLPIVSKQNGRMDTEKKHD